MRSTGIDGDQDPGVFILDFDRPLTSAVVEMGDIGQDADNLLLQAYSDVGGMGTLLRPIPDFLWQAETHSDSIRFPSPPLAIRSLRMIGGSANFPNSVFYDNIVITAVPEPSSVATCWFVGALTAMRRRRVATR